MAGLTVTAAVALGSNLGDRAAILRQAVADLSRLLSGMRVSRFVETDPVGVGPQPRFLNAAVVGETSLAPLDLLDELQRLEQTAGRERPYPGAPRTLDLDLILCGDAVLDTPRLTLPHPRFRARAFVIGPLAEIAPAMVDPVSGQTIAALWQALDLRNP